MQNKIEKEYRFLTDQQNLNNIPPKTIGDFKLLNRQVTEHIDYLFERKVISLKDDNVGFRIRKSSEKIEFTYKKFLGFKNNIVQYDEFTLPISQALLDRFLENKFSGTEIKILQELANKGELYYLLTIKNKRFIYTYKYKDTICDLIIEDLEYIHGKLNKRDTMVEVEINTINDNLKSTSTFIETIKQIYNVKTLNQGKNARAMKLLGISN